MKFVDIDRSQAPVLVYKFSSKDPSDQEFEAYLKDLVNDWKSYSGSVIINDLSEAKYLSSENRIKVGKVMKDNEEMMTQSVKALVYVMPSVILNMLLKGIFAIKKPPVEVKIVKTREEAIRWATEKTKMAAVA